mgnify:FL=1
MEFEACNAPLQRLQVIVIPPIRSKPFFLNLEVSLSFCLRDNQSRENRANLIAEIDQLAQ